MEVVVCEFLMREFGVFFIEGFYFVVSIFAFEQLTFAENFLGNALQGV